MHSCSYDANHSIRSASLRSSVAGVHVKRAGKNTLLPNSTRPSTAGLTQFRITVGLALEYLRLALSWHSVVRWDPRCEDETFFVQSANLRSTYYFIQIAIHRPFIPSSRKGSSLSFAALAICASAARAYSHVADALRKKYPLRTSPLIIVRAFSFLTDSTHLFTSGLVFAQFPAFASAVVLLLSLWGARRTGTTLDPVKEMQDVRKCIMVLETSETRWSIAGRLRCVSFSDFVPP